MRKKIFSILLILCMCVSVFAGCSLVEIDEKSYQDAIVTTITYTDGEKDQINKRELLLAYSSYGYNYNSDGNYNAAIDQTLDSVIDQHITIKAVRNYYKNLDVNNDEDETNDEPLLNGNETSYLWEQTRSSLFDNIEEKYFGILNYEAGEAEEDSTTEAGVVYKKYQSSVDFQNGIITTNETTLSTRNNPENLKELEKDGETYVYDFESEEYDFKTELFNALYNAMGTDKKEKAVRDWRGAISQYVDIVERNFSYLEYKTDEEWLKFEIQRVYDILKNNYLIEKYTEIYNKTQQNREINYSNIQVDDVLDYYKERVLADYGTYKSDSSAYSNAILNSTGDVDYFLDNGNENYFYVSAIKVNISSSQQKRLDEANKSGNPLEVEAAKKEVFDNVKATLRDVKVGLDGEVVGTGGKTNQKINVTDLGSELEAKISAISFKTAANMSDAEKEEAYSELNPADRTDAQKQNEAIDRWLKKENALVARERAAIFRDYTFKYSDDDSTKNADYGIVFGFDSSNNTILANSTFSGNESVTQAIKDLYESKPEIGTTTGPVQVDDGYYIFFYAGAVENIVQVTGGNLNIQEDFIYRLRETRTSLFSDKTLFDVLYDELSSNYSDNFSVFQNLDIEALKDKEDSERRIVVSINTNGDELYN